MNFLKSLGEICAMLIIVSIVSLVSPTLAALLCFVVLIVAFVAVIRPFPALRLPTRGYNLAVAVFVGFFGVLIPATMMSSAQRAERAELAELKATDTTAYLAKLESTDREKWLDELQSLDPARYAEEKAKVDAEQAEQARLAAEAKAKADAERAEAERIAAQERAEAAKAAALRSLEADKSTVRSQIEMLNWSGAKTTITRISNSDADVGDFLDETETAALEIVKALPSSDMADLKSNQLGYEFLAALRPDNGGYAAKATDYATRIDKARKAAVAKLRRKEDKVEGVTFFQHPNQPKYLNSRSTAYLYIGRRGEQGRPWLRMKVQYTASDWLFVERVFAWHDGIKEELTSDTFNRDNNSTIWEWVDVTPDPYQIEVLESLANAKEAVLRFEGMQYRKDVTLSAADKQALRDVLLAYRVMSGED